jgi:hypothetical protein
VGIGFSLFLFVVGAILTFAVDVDSSGSGFNLNTVGVILMVGGLLGLLFSALLWSSFAPWRRRRTVAGATRWSRSTTPSGISPNRPAAPIGRGSLGRPGRGGRRGDGWSGRRARRSTCRPRASRPSVAGWAGS